MSSLDWPGEPIKIVFVDVDGTLTDGGMYFTAEGLAMKRFCVKDGLGLVRLQEAGVEVVIVSADDSPITVARARKLGVGQVILGCRDKAAEVREMLAERGLSPREACYIGDDLTDLPAFAEVGHAAAPADAVPEVLAAAEYVSRARGGQGAVREICDLLRAALEEVA